MSASAGFLDKRGVLLAFFSLVALLLVCGLDSTAEAAATTATASITILGIPISFAEDQTMSFRLGKVGAQSVYGGTALKAVLPAKIRATQTLNSSSVTTVAPTVTLTKGSSSAVLSLVCRVSTGAYVTGVGGGSDCGQSTTTQDGVVYLSLFPTGVDLSGSDNATGNYAGTITVSTDYN